MEVSYNDWKKLDIRVGEITEVTDHPNADKLLVFKVDVGEEKTIVAGIKNNYDKSELIGRKVVVFCNLAQRELRGIKSEGMILAAVDGEDVCLLQPDNDIKNGAKIE
mgnify:FL=1